jgi:hypothetical protein
MTEWIHDWKRNNWKTSQKGQVINTALRKALDESVRKHQSVVATCMKAHSYLLLNECADTPATPRRVGVAVRYACMVLLAEQMDQASYELPDANLTEDSGPDTRPTSSFVPKSVGSLTTAYEVEGTDEDEGEWTSSIRREKEVTGARGCTNNSH